MTFGTISPSEVYLIIGTGMWTLASFVFARHVVVPQVCRHLVRRRLLPHQLRSRTAFQNSFNRARLWRRGTPAPRSDDERHADALDAVGRELRLGASMHAAIVAVVARHDLSEWRQLAATCREGRPLTDLVRSDDFAMRSIGIAANGGDAVHAVETAARTLRVNAGIAADSRAAVAHMRSSMSVLTWVPAVIALWLFVRNPAARSFFTSSAGIACVGVGASLQWVGRRIVRRMTRSACGVDADIPDFVDALSIHLRVGRPPALAFIHASESTRGDLGAASRMVAAAVTSGERFLDALTSHRHAFGIRAQALIDALVDTERDGLPPRVLFDRLSADAHALRRREADARLRALPVRLTLPLVCCILPAYVVLAVVPLLASQLSSVNFDLN